MAKAKNNNNEEPIEKQLWKAADKLRKNIDAAEYKHIILGLIFLKYISDAFEQLFGRLKKAGILHNAPKVVDTFLRRLPKNGAWLQKVSIGK